VFLKQVTTLVNDELPEGDYEVTFDASGLSSGIYFYQVISGSNRLSKQMVFKVRFTLLSIVAYI